MTQCISMFCEMVKRRSFENRKALESFSNVCDVISPAVSILRQELDSMARVVYLLNIEDVEKREILAAQILDGKKWETESKNGKPVIVRDADIIDVANGIQGWSKAVYKFGCAFIHLTSFHNYYSRDPFELVAEEEKSEIIHYLKYYHGYQDMEPISIKSICKYIPMIFEKIASNLEDYLIVLSRDGTEEDLWDLE